MPTATAEYGDWIGKQRRSRQMLDPWPVQALSALLDLPVPAPGQSLPGLWHWLYFLETAARSRIGADGHPCKGEFMPPVPNPRRMFAGARTHYHQALQIGAPTDLSETVLAIEDKPGKFGTMSIVSVGYEYRQEGALCVAEERDFIYLPAATARAAPIKLSDELLAIAATPWSLDIVTDPVLLMRFSALTFNSHRIHYDADYAREQEGYPALVVHGPLSAILLSELCRLHGNAELASFSFRAMNPVFVGQTLRLRGEPDGRGGAALNVYTPAGKPAVTASASFR
ncbi:MAG: MaoC/PaaZ C-terminal domain-containing protein [Gammaproteobacteria bacterium]|nr:MaoC/PaaZ C-terminal domain-containing protein [Gammaproteobacteria bacterium]